MYSIYITVNRVPKGIKRLFAQTINKKDAYCILALLETQNIWAQVVYIDEYGKFVTVENEIDIESSKILTIN